MTSRSHSSRLSVLRHVHADRPPTHRTGKVPSESVVVTEQLFVDRSRRQRRGRLGRRRLPTTIWSTEGNGERRLVIFAHGFGLAATQFDDLFRTLAQSGYIVAAPSFPGLRSTDGRARDVSDYVNHPADIRFVADQVLEAGGNGGHNIAADRIALIGHSIGGSAVLATTFTAGLSDARVVATVVINGISLPYPGRAGTHPDAHAPILFVHGTHDSLVPIATARDRFRRVGHPGFFLTLVGSPHVPATPHQRRALLETIPPFLDGAFDQCRWDGHGLLTAAAGLGAARLESI